MGTRGNKSKAKEAARDLSGRRMRDVNAEKKYDVELIILYMLKNGERVG